MRVTIRWATATTRGRVPGSFTTVQEAEEAAKSFLAEYPSVTWCGIYHDTSGHVMDVTR